MGCPCRGVPVPWGARASVGPWRGHGGHSVGILRPEVPIGCRVGRTDGGSWGGQCWWGGGCHCGGGGGVPKPGPPGDTRSRHTIGGSWTRRGCGAAAVPPSPGGAAAVSLRGGPPRSPRAVSQPRGRGQPPPVQVSSPEAPSPGPASAVSHRPGGGRARGAAAPGVRVLRGQRPRPAGTGGLPRALARGSRLAGLRGRGRRPIVPWESMAEPRPSRPIPPRPPIRLRAFPAPREPPPENPAWNPGLADGVALSAGSFGVPGGAEGTPVPPAAPFPPCPGVGLLGLRGS